MYSFPIREISNHTVRALSTCHQSERLISWFHKISNENMACYLSSYSCSLWAVFLRGSLLVCLCATCKGLSIHETTLRFRILQWFHLPWSIYSRNDWRCQSFGLACILKLNGPISEHTRGTPDLVPILPNIAFRVSEIFIFERSIPIGGNLGPVKPSGGANWMSQLASENMYMIYSMVNLQLDEWLTVKG